MLWLVAIALALGAEEPSDHTLIYYNARMALREGRSGEAVKLWLLRNALEDATGQVSPHDADFRSVTWAALGDLGVCQDGTRTDEDGAGLWPLAMHNWVVRNMGRRGSPGRPRPFDAYEVGRQQRFISINDVLSPKELNSVRLFRGPCVRPHMALVGAGEVITASLSDRQIVARLLRHLLEEARQTLHRDRTRGMAVIEARLFDIDLQLTALAAREARQEAREEARKAGEVGLSRESITAMREEAPITTLDPLSPAAQVLRECVSWPTEEWLALSPDRRLFLFDQARAYGANPAAMDAIALGLIDALAARGEGSDVAKWIGRVGSEQRPEAREQVWMGQRGQALLALDRDVGFGERSVLALHRGVHFLEAGDQLGALRSFAFALQHADESAASAEVEALSLRWLTWVASRYQVTDDLLITLQQLVPRRGYSSVLEDLMWRSAFHADKGSFERGLSNQLGRDALGRRLELLTPLAAGNVTGFAAGLAERLESSPSEALRFLEQLVPRLELEDEAVRRNQVPTLLAIEALLEPLAQDLGGTGRRGRTTEELLQRSQAIIEGVVGPAAQPDASEGARALAPGSEVFAGSVRLAPADPLPWPFRPTQPPPPSVFTPIQLVPVEWRDASGELVFGWSIRG